MHGKERGIQDIYLVNLFGRYDADSPSKRFFLNHFTQSITLVLRQLLGVIQ
jgi:hypothetical protein